MIGIALIVIINILFYYRTISYAGICDDIPIFNLVTEIPKGWWMNFWYHLHGRKYKSWKLAHSQTLAIHTINSVLIYIVFGMNTVSLLAALLFSVNPVNNQCSIWISGKGYSMNTTCALLMWMFPLFSPVIYLVGTYFCGASLVLFPLIFLFTKYWWLASLALIGLWREKGRIWDKKNPASKYNTESNKELLTIHWGKVILAFRTYGYYFSNAILAFRLGFYHGYCFLHGVNEVENKKSYKIDMYFFIGVALGLVTLYTLNIYLLWFTISLAVWLNLMTFNQTIANRYVYFPNVGAMLLLASLVVKFPPLFFVLITYYATKLAFFVIAYKNEYWSIEYSCLEQPDFFYPWQNRAVHCFQNQNYHGALGNMIKANELRPDDWKIVYNIAQIYMMVGNLAETRKYYEQAQKCMIDGREEQINKLMERLGKWIKEVEEQAKESGKVNIDIGKFDMQR